MLTFRKRGERERAIMTKHEDIWREQCDATVAIRARYGERAALDYLVGEKLLHFTTASRDHPAFAAQLPSFVARVRRMFEREGMLRYLTELDARLVKESQEVDLDDIALTSGATNALASLRHVADLLRAETLGTS